MASASKATSGSRVKVPFVIPDAAERERRLQKLMRRFAELDAEADEEGEVDTMTELREALGAKRIISSRDLFP